MVWSTTLSEKTLYRKKDMPNHKQDWTANKHLRDAQPKTGPEVDSPQKYPALDTHAPATHPTHTRRQHPTTTRHPRPQCNPHSSARRKCACSHAPPEALSRS